MCRKSYVSFSNLIFHFFLANASTVTVFVASSLPITSLPSLTVTSLTVTFTGTVPPVPNTVILPVALSTTAASVFKDSNSTLTLFNSVTVLPNWF